MAQLRRFPWERLPKVSRDVLRARRDLLVWATSRVDVARVGFAAGRLLKVPVEIAPLFDGPPARELAPPLCEIELRCGEVVLWIGIESSLAAKIAGIVLGHPVIWVDPVWSPDASVAGAVGAFLLVLARRVTSSTWPWVVGERSNDEPEPSSVSAGRGLSVGEFWARTMIGTEAFVFRVRAVVPVIERALTRDALASLGEIRLTIPAVGAVLSFPRREVLGLRVGDVVAPGDAWTLTCTEGRWNGSLLLVAPWSERGMRVDVRGELARGADLVIAPGPHASPWDRSMSHDPSDPSSHASLGMPGMPTIAGTLGTDESGAVEALADAPIVVRVELATVTLTAQAWAELSPGGVVATGVRIGAPVVLRVGGVAIARGELCDLDGEIAVRILERGETDR